MSALTTKRTARVVLKIATNIQGKNPVGTTAANTNPVTIGGVDGDNKIKGLVLNDDGAATVVVTSSSDIMGAVLNHGDIPNIVTTTPLLVNATFTQGAIDRQEQTIPIGSTRIWVNADQSGTLYLEESHNGTNWTTTATNVVSAGVQVIRDWTVLTRRYVRIRYVNGVTAQESFKIQQYFIGVGVTPVRAEDGTIVSIGSKGDAAVTDPSLPGSEIALLKGLLTKINTIINGTTPATTILTGSRGSVIAHRTAITAVDKVSTVTITAADQVGVAGSLTAVAHGIGVAPGNSYGSAGVLALVTVTPTVNKSIDITIPQATGAEYYDIFLSTSTTAPAWVGRVTEAERAAGCAITAVGTIGEGGSAGVVNVQVVGTGQASTASYFAQNNAHTPNSETITEINCSGKLKAFVYAKMTLTDLCVAPTLSLVPFFQKNEESTEWYQGQAQTVYILGSLGQSLYQVFEIDCLSAKGMKLLIGTLSGNGASVNVDVELM